MTSKEQSNFDLPLGWKWTTVNDICTLKGRIGWRGYKKTDLTSEGPYVLGATHLSKKWKVNLEKPVFIARAKYLESPDIMVNFGDILVAHIGASIGKIALVDFDLGEATINPNINLLKNIKINNKFLLYNFASPFIQSQLQKGITSTATPMITQEFLKNLKVPLAPLAEQNRIVNKVEELFSFLDAGVASLKTVQAQLKRYRQAVLKHAFEGKLTEQWRLTHKEQSEPAKKLLEQIIAERKKKLGGKYSERPMVEFDDTPTLPDSWVWTNCGTISWLITSGSRDWKKYYNDKGPIFLRTQDINTNKLKLEKVAHVSIPEKAEGKRSLVEENDILTIITGANVGKVALVDRAIGEAYISQSVALMKLAMPQIAKFVHYSMISEGFGKTFLNKLVYGMGRPVLSLESIRDVLVPLAPLTEQRQIVSKIECYLSELDDTEKTMSFNIKSSEHMRQSILRAAFEGKLVPQNVNDEPAEKLLERIKAERLSNKSKNNQVELSKYV